MSYGQAKRTIYKAHATPGLVGVLVVRFVSVLATLPQLQLPCRLAMEEPFSSRRERYAWTDGAMAQSSKRRERRERERDRDPPVAV